MDPYAAKSTNHMAKSVDYHASTSHSVNLNPGTREAGFMHHAFCDSCPQKPGTISAL